MDLLIFRKHHLDSGEYQERPEDIDDPVELGYKRNPGYYENSPHHNRAEHAPKKYLVLIDGRHAEIGEDLEEDKYIVHAQGFLDDVPGKELYRGLRPLPEVYAGIKSERQADPYAAPDKRLLYLHLMVFTVEDPKVDREHGHYEDREKDPWNQMCRQAKISFYLV